MRTATAPAAGNDELRKIAEDIGALRPDLADRLRAIADASEAEAEDGLLRSGPAAEALGISRNTLKKWVRTGLIRDGLELPNGEIRAPVKEIQRLREYAAGRIAIALLGDEIPTKRDEN